MAQLWGGRFTKETDQLVQNFNESLSFDQLRGLDGMSEKRCRTVIIRMAENDAYLRECDENKDTKNYIVSLLKDYYEGRLRGIALRYQ